MPAKRETIKSITADLRQADGSVRQILAREKGDYCKGYLFPLPTGQFACGQRVSKSDNNQFFMILAKISFWLCWNISSLVLKCLDVLDP